MALNCYICLLVTIESPIDVDFVDTTQAVDLGRLGLQPVDPVITTTLWSFGDEICCRINTSHIYDSPGFYDVGLMFSLAGG